MSVFDIVCRWRRLCVSFFFQEEDGIRDLVRSRGLGDVYKRQAAGRLAELTGKPVAVAADVGGEDSRQKAEALEPGDVLLLENTRYEAGETDNDPEPVSYTHLTLPTSDLV